MGIPIIGLCFQCFRRWRDEIQRLQWLRSNEKNQLWMFQNRRWSEVMMPQAQMVHLRWVWWIWNGFFREGCCNSLNSDSVLKLWQSGKILNLDSLPIWVCPRAKHQNFWGEDPAAQGKPRCLEPQSRMDPVVLHHQNPKLVQLLDQIFTPDHHKLVEIAMSTSQGSRVICLRTLLGRWWVASWPKPWGERIGGSTGWKSHVSTSGGTVPYKAIFWSLRHDNRPICSMLGLCRVHVGDGPMLSPSLAT